MSDHIDQLRDLLIQFNAEPPVDASDSFLAATYPPACQTCGGTGVEPTGSYTYEGEALYHDCPDCPTIAQLLAWGVAVATAEMVDKRHPDLFAPAFYDGYNSRLEVLRAVKP